MICENIGINEGHLTFAGVDTVKMAEKYGKDKVIATILADRAERYFSTSLI